MLPGSSSRLRLASLTVTPASAVTVTAFEVRLPLPVWVAAGTRTASVGRARKSPVKASVSVAVVPPALTPEICAMERFGMVVTSSNAPVPAAGAPAAKVVPLSVTATVAPCRVDSVSAAGVGVMATPTWASATVTATLGTASVVG